MAINADFIRRKDVWKQKNNSSDVFIIIDHITASPLNLQNDRNRVWKYCWIENWEISEWDTMDEKDLSKYLDENFEIEKRDHILAKLHLLGIFEQLRPF